MYVKYCEGYQGRRTWLVGLKKLTYLKIPTNNSHLLHIYSVQMSEKYGASNIERLKELEV